VRHFFRTITSNPIWEETSEERILWIPLLEGWERRPFQTHIVSLRTRPRHEQFLFLQLLLNKMNSYPMAFPVVPKGKSRVRIVIHAHNTLEQIDALVSVVCEWAREMLEIEHGKTENVVPGAARRVYAAQAALKP
jgi:8-amino-7-oxononanoate synthase